MSKNQETVFACRSWSGVALIVMALLAPAHAEAPTAARPLAHAASAAAPASAPATMPAAVAPSLPRSDARPALPARPAALRPATSATPPAPTACRAPAELTRFDHPLLHTARILSGGEPLTIVAIGSSSTAGAGASSRAASYPSRLALELEKLLPGHAIKVLNRGVNGEETPDMMARFATAVIAQRPQLVLWQLGTNSVLRDQPLKIHAVELHEGIEELKQIGTDLVLIDPQYAPKVIAKPETLGMVEQIALAAKDENVDLFHRFAVMRDWYEVQHRSFDAFVSPDGLHMNDWGYACWAKLLAASIAAAANPPVASAVEHRP
jgi:acyl-CoA thioesterase I